MPPRMRVADFMSILHDRTLALLPDDMREACNAKVRFVWFQVHFHSPRVHYEVCLTRKTERIEIGLHFEGPHDFSYRWAALFAERLGDVLPHLGAAYELEEWTASWARLHETLPYDPPSEHLADEIATRMARLITVCQPVIEQLRDQVPLELEAEAPRTNNRGRPFRHRRRAHA